MRKPKSRVPAAKPDPLFDRIVTILEQARGNVVRAVNTNMVLAYWLIGREIVQELQDGEERAGYGRKVIDDLSVRLTERYGQGYSEQNLQNFRRFYLVYSDRVTIPSPSGRESDTFRLKQGITRPMGAESSETEIPSPTGRELASTPISHPSGAELTPVEKSYPSNTELPQGFSPQLSWSHYRALMRVENVAARDFYTTRTAKERLDDIYAALPHMVLLDALMSIEGFRNLNQDIETIINKSEAVKKIRKEANDQELSAKEKKELSEEEKEFKSKRKEIQEKLIKFATRVPIFMYLTDYRERTLKDVISQLEPGLFKKVTGLIVKDFELLVSLGVFNSALLNDAVYKFKRYEDASLSYTGINKHEGEDIGLYDTVITRRDAKKVFENIPARERYRI